MIVGIHCCLLLQRHKKRSPYKYLTGHHTKELATKPFNSKAPSRGRTLRPPIPRPGSGCAELPRGSEVSSHAWVPSRSSCRFWWCRPGAPRSVRGGIETGHVSVGDVEEAKRDSLELENGRRHCHKTILLSRFLHWFIIKGWTHIQAVGPTSY